MANTKPATKEQENATDVKTGPFTALLESVLGGIETLFITKTRKGSILSAASQGSAAQVRAPTLDIAGMADNDVIAVDFKGFTGACKGRSVSSLRFVPETSELVIKSGASYNASIATLASPNAPRVEESQNDNKVDIKLSDSAKQILANALRATKIEKTYSGITDTIVYIESNVKSILIASFEPSQVAYTVTGNKQEGFPLSSLVLPTGIIAKCLLIPGEINIQVNSMTALFRSKVCDVLVPLPEDTINAITKDQVLGLIKSSAGSVKSASVGFSMGKSKILAFMDNAESIISSGADISVKPAGEGSVILSVTTAKGIVKEKFKGSVERPFSLGFSFMKAALTRAGSVREGADDPLVSLYLTDSFAIIKNESDKSTYLASLSE